MSRFVSTAAAVLTLMCSVVSAADWGNVSGKIVWKGDVPEPVLLHAKGAAVKDAAVCAAIDAYAQDLVVDKDSKGISNVFIYLARAPKTIHPDAEKFEPSVVFDQKNCTFKPHTLIVRAGQSVEVLNSDPIPHNTHTYPLRNTGENRVVAADTAPGKGTMFPTKSKELLPIQVKCDFHPWMAAYWLILDHPYMAITEKDGTFEIKNLPAGKHEFRIWHERVGYLERKLKVTIKADETTELKPLEYKIEKKNS